MNSALIYSLLILTGTISSPVCLIQDTQPTQSETALALVFQSAERHFQAGEYESAFKDAEELCQRSASESRNHFLKGQIAFASGKMRESIAAFDRVIELRPESKPHLWQRGLALYYAKRYEEGVAQFETHQTVNSQDVENAVWHLLCAARVDDITEARKSLIPIVGDTRVPMSQIYEMFAGRMEPEEVLAAAEQATSKVPAGSTEHQLQLYYAHLYTGLYREMLGDATNCKAEMQAAVEINPLPKNNFMGRVAPVHLLLAEQSD